MGMAVVLMANCGALLRLYVGACCYQKSIQILHDVQYNKRSTIFKKAKEAVSTHSSLCLVVLTINIYVVLSLRFLFLLHFTCFSRKYKPCL